MKFKRFTKPEFLKTVGRNSLALLFGKFAPALAAKNVELPKPEWPDDEYFKSFAQIALAPDALPDDCIEPLFCIEEMANEEGLEHVQRGAVQAGLPLTFGDDTSIGDAIVQAYLAKPELVAEKHNEMRLVRLSSFEYYGAKIPMDQSATFKLPDENGMRLLTSDLDAWFKANNRGNETAVVEAYLIEGEWWFLVRHGDTFARAPKVDRRKLEIIHYRPAKDDVVVYCPKRDELRIHAGTKGERELYRKAFGHRLRGDDAHFSQRKAYTLEPLREHGSDALGVDGVSGLDRVVLCELEVAYDNGHAESVIRRADDLFAAAKERNVDAVPKSGRLVRAKFDFYFRGLKKPRPVQLRPPNILKLGRHCDAAIVQQWLSVNGFRAGNKVDDGLFAIAKAMSPEGKVILAPPFDVLRLYCVENLSRNDIAKRCRCAPSLVSLRFRELERQFQRPMKSLRTLSDNFTRVVDSFSDSRARHIHRKSATFGNEEDSEHD